MAKLVAFVKIFGVGTGNDSSIGMVDGNLQWCSVSGYSGWYNGFIDHNLLDIPGQAINIAAGGGLGGFDGKAEVNAIDITLHNAVYTGSISVIGKQVAIFVGVDPATFANAKVTFNGKVSTQGFPDEISVSMVCDPSMDFDSKKVSEIVVTQEMALNYEDSGAIGESVLPTYGNVVNYPMIFCDPASGIRAHMNGPLVFGEAGLSEKQFQDNAPAYLEESNILYENMNATLNEFRGKYLLQVVGLWQSSETENVWCALSANGKDLWAGDYAEGIVDNIRTAIVGQNLVVTGGTGSGSSFLVVDVEWNTHATSWNEVSLETIWLRLDTSDISSMKSSLPWVSSAPGDSVDGNSHLRNKSFYDNVTSYYDPTTDYLNAPYEDGKNREDVSIVAFMEDANIFIVNESADLLNGKIVSYVDNVVVNVDASVNQIAIGNGWKMLRLSSIGSKNKEGTITQINSKSVQTFFFGDSGEFFNHSVLYTSAPTNNMSLLHGVTDKQLISDSGTTVTKLTDAYSFYASSFVVSKSSFFINMRELFDGNDLGNGSFDFFLMPDVKHQFDLEAVGTALNGNVYIDFSINVDIISDGNLVVGRKTFESSATFYLSISEFTREDSVFMRINPTNKTIDFSSTCTSHDPQSKTLYSAALSAIGLKGLASMCNSIKHVNGVLITLESRQRKNLNPDFTLHANSVVCQSFPCQISYSREIDKKKLFYQCVLDDSVTCPAGIIKSIADSNGLSTDSGSFTSTIAAQRELFSGIPANFDGQFQPSSGNSISDVIQAIAEQSMTAVFVDSAGNIQARFLPKEMTSYTFDFNGENVITDGLSFSQPKSGYVYSDFAFSTVLNPFEKSSSIGIDTDGVSSFPEENDYELGSIIFSPSTGWSVETGYNGSLYRFRDYFTLTIRGPSRELLYMFVEGTIWEYSNNFLNKRFIVRVDSTASDMQCPLDSYGVVIGVYVIEVIDDESLTERSLRTYGPRAKWRDFVSGVSVDNYAIAESMWQMAYAARATLGKEQKAPTSSTKLEQPVWGSDPMTIGKWAQSVVSYCTKNKIVISFDSPYSADVQGVNFMDHVQFSWGPYSATPISGYVVELKPNLASKTISFTLLCYGQYVALPAIITELGELFQFEDGEIIEPEVGETSKKIGALSLVDPQTAFDAGGDLLVTVPGVGNYRLDIPQFVEFIRGPGATEILVGTVGATSFSVSNPLGTDKIAYCVYDSVTNDKINLSLTVTDALISASGLSPIEVTNQFRIIMRS